MDVEEGTSNGDAVECSEGIKCLKSKAIDNVGGFGTGSNDLPGWILGKTEGFQTYKRRRHGKSSSESKSQDERQNFTKVDGQMSHEPFKEPQGVGVIYKSCKQIRLPTDCQDDCSQRSWKIVLEHMCPSFSSDEGGMQRCIQDALETCPEIGSMSKAKEHDHSEENRQTCLSPTRNPLNSFQKENSGNPDALANGHLDDFQHTVTKKCRHAWFNILLSEKYISLHKLLSENFQGNKIDSFLDLKLIDSRMKDGVYGRSPMLFLTDMEQVWEKINKIGTEMISLAQNLSNISSSCYNQEFCSWESDAQTKTEQGEHYSSYRACTCPRCGNKAYGRDCLVCDSCEEMYHVSCIEPAVQEIPSKSWYCGSCSPSGIQSPHKDCVVCERLNAPKSTDKVVDVNSFCAEETHNEFGENSNLAEDEGFQLSKSSKSLGLCKICGSEIHDGEKSKACSHKYCPSKFYHVRCLAKKQLKSYGPGWYCPSCLCRSCLTDKDDDRIVLCDGCDHAYHIYCTKPELPSIPSGKWFCRSCDAKLMQIQRAKKAYEKYGNKQKKKDSEGARTFGNMGMTWTRKGCIEQDKVGGMEMLLTAVNTLNYEENLARI